MCPWKYVLVKAEGNYWSNSFPCRLWCSVSLLIILLLHLGNNFISSKEMLPFLFSSYSTWQTSVLLFFTLFYRSPRQHILHLCVTAAAEDGIGISDAAAPWELPGSRNGTGSCSEFFFLLQSLILWKQQWKSAQFIINWCITGDALQWSYFLLSYC